MLDLKQIRQNPQEMEKKLQSKDSSVELSSILQLDTEIRTIQAEVEEIKSQRNALSKQIGEKKRAKEDASSILAEVSGLGDLISSQDQKLKELEKQRFEKLALLPNLPMDEVPIAEGPEDNVCIKEYGVKREFSFPFKNHLELNEQLHFFDFQRGAKIAGTGWPLYTDMGARLEWALIQYMLDTHRKNGFIQIMPPLLARRDIMYGSAHLPKFEDQLFKITDEDFDLFLIPTSEATLNGMHFDEILDEEELPKKYVAYTPCFRREAGAAGKNERGLIRTHQFNKVELFCLTKPEDSVEMMEVMLKSAEEVVEGLELHYRNMLLTTGDMSFASAKTIDLEVWLPGQNRYYEVSSISNCTDFQARRSQIRYRSKGEKPEYVHSLNGSGVATSRLMVSLLENHQRKDGSIAIPKVLQSYLEQEIFELKPNSCL